MFVFISSKTFELQGFRQLIDQIAESKKTSADQIIGKINGTGGPSLAHVTVSIQSFHRTKSFFFSFISHRQYRIKISLIV